MSREPSQSGGQFLDSILTKIHDPRIFRDRNNMQAMMLAKRQKKVNINKAKKNGYFIQVNKFVPSNL